MDQRSEGHGRTEQATIEPPRWMHCVLALAGAVLLIGPTLGVLWPR